MKSLIKKIFKFPNELMIYAPSHLIVMSSLKCSHQLVLQEISVIAFKMERLVDILEIAP